MMHMLRWLSRSVDSLSSLNFFPSQQSRVHSCVYKFAIPLCKLFEVNQNRSLNPGSSCQVYTCQLHKLLLTDALKACSQKNLLITVMHVYFPGYVKQLLLAFRYYNDQDNIETQFLSQGRQDQKHFYTLQYL